MRIEQELIFTQDGCLVEVRVYPEVGDNAAVIEKANEIIARMLDRQVRYSPDQPRDEYGRFASGSGGSAQKSVDKSEKNGIIKADISIGKSLSASAKNYPVRLPDSKQRVKLAEGQTIHGKVFAGYGTSHEIRDRYIVASHYGIPFDDVYKMQKASGNGYIILDGAKRKAELHWYQIAGDKFAEKYDMKVKRFIDEDKV